MVYIDVTTSPQSQNLALGPLVSKKTNVFLLHALWYCAWDDRDSCLCSRSQTPQ